MTQRSAWLHASASSLALVLGALATGHLAHAQTNNPPPPPANGQNQAVAQNGAPPPVIVTAERRAVNLQQAPLAATVATGEQLKARGVYGLDQLQFISPSLTVTDYGIGEDYNIRGVGKSEENVQVPSGIVIYRDGVATFQGFFTEEPYYDISNVEVLRGPQGTLAGQNASGGAIFITEADPSFAGPSIWGEAQYGNYNDFRVRTTINIPVSDTFAVRIAANAEHEDSYYSVTGPGSGGDLGELQTFSARASLLWQPNAAWRIEFKNDFTYLDYGGIPNSPVPIPAAPPYPTYASSSGLFNISTNIHNLSLATWDRSALNIAYTFPDGIVVKSITGYQIGRGAFNQDIDGTALEGDNFTVIGKENVTSEEVNVISPNTGPFKWVAGGYFQYDDVRIPFGIPGFDIHAPPLDVLLDYHTPKTTEAVFGQLTYDITDQLQVEAGARFTHSTFEITDATTIILFGVLNLGAEHTHLTQNDDKLTGQVALNWKLNPNNLLYALVATGHKPGGINTTPMPFAAGPNATAVPFSPEDLVDYEIGWKPTFFDGHLRAQLDAFYTTYTNHQLSFASNAVGGGAEPGQSIIRNVPGTSVHYGVEAQAQGVFGPWSFDVSADYLHTRLGSAAGSCISVPVSQSCVTGPLSVPEFIGGNEEPYAPTWSFNVGAQYRFDLPDGSTLTPRADYGYLGWQWASLWQGSDPNEVLAARLLERYVYKLAPTNILNLQLTWDKGPFELSLFGTNVLNDHYFNESTGTATVLGPPQFPTFRVLRVAAPPAQFGVRVSRSF